MNKMDKSELENILEALNNHGVIAFPTETVMGLGVFYNDYEAYCKLNKVKNRPEDKPYTLMLGSIEEIEKYAYINEHILKIIKTFMPGSITVLLKSKENVPNYVTHNTGIIGIRIPSNDIALELLTYINEPLLVPSANKSGEKPALNSDEVKTIFNNELDYIVNGSSQKGQPSTIIDISSNQIKMIREGGVSFDEILKVWETNYSK